MTSSMSAGRDSAARLGSVSPLLAINVAPASLWAASFDCSDSDSPDVWSGPVRTIRQPLNSAILAAVIINARAGQGEFRPACRSCPAASVGRASPARPSLVVDGNINGVATLNNKFIPQIAQIDADFFVEERDAR